MTARSNRWWTLDEGTFTASYTSDRNLAWQYDDAGNVKNNLQGTYVYDVAGRMKQFDSANTIHITQLYDGDGLPAYRLETHPGLIDRATIYYVRSSVLGGQTITELKANGGKRRTYVYAGGGEIARQEKIGNAPDSVTWMTRDPITGDEGFITRDPLGGFLGNEFSVLEPDYAALKGDATTHDTDADPFDSGSGCTLDGAPIDCSSFARLVNNGAVSAQVGGKLMGDVSHVGIGGFWIKQWTPSEPTSTNPDPEGPLSLNVTDNAYSDVWVPFAGADKRQAKSASPGPRRLAGVLKELFEFLAGLLPGHSEQCLRGLRTARQTRTSVNEANKFAGTLRQAAASHGIDWRVLAAVSIRETGFQNIDQQGGPGRAGGYFQIDFNAHPNISREQAFDINWAADWTAGQFASDIAKYEDTGFTPELSLAGAIRNHNAGPKYTLKKLKRDQLRGGFASLNAGTWHSNYVTNILDLMDCFAP